MQTVEIGRGMVVKVGGSTYLRLPTSLKYKSVGQPGTKVAFHQAPRSTDITIRPVEEEVEQSKNKTGSSVPEVNRNDQSS